MSLFDRDKSAERMPVSVVTGFLGSGKTTLLNHLLRHPDMADSAVIVNEFGEIGLDHLLMEVVSGEVSVMANGCVCCTFRGDLADSLRGLLARRDSGEVPPFRRVLVETTGLADPAPIAQMLLNNPLVSHFARLDTLIATVDAVNAPRQLAEHQEAVKQVAMADRLLLTKTDLDLGAGLRPTLARLNPAAPLLETRFGVADPASLFGAALFDPARKIPDVAGWLNEAAYHAHEHGDDHDHDHAHGAGSAIQSFCLTTREPLDWDRVSAWMGALRDRHGADLLRVKGILALLGETAPIAVHGVHHVFHPPVQLAGWPDADHRGRIVFITRDLDRDHVLALARSAGLGFDDQPGA
jgi:G3E family GTPase